MEKGIKIAGKLGQWTISKNMHQEILSTQQSVKQRIDGWIKQHHDQLYVGEQPLALTIHQPFLDAILRRKKKFENRKVRTFHLHPNKAVAPLPPVPKPTLCKFCPSDNDKCISWIHVSESKKKTKKKSKRGIKRKHNELEDKEEEGILQPQQKKMKTSLDENDIGLKKDDVITFDDDSSAVIIQVSHSSALIETIDDGKLIQKCVNLAVQNYELLENKRSIMKFMNRIKIKRNERQYQPQKHRRGRFATEFDEPDVQLLLIETIGSFGGICTKSDIVKGIIDNKGFRIDGLVLEMNLRYLKENKLITFENDTISFIKH